MSPRFVLGRENVPSVAEVVDRSLKADCTDFTALQTQHGLGIFGQETAPSDSPVQWILWKNRIFEIFEALFQ